MSGLPANTIAVEYTIGTGAGFFNNPSTLATSTSSADNSNTTSAGAGVGTALPANADSVAGQLFAVGSVLYIFNGATWVATT